jgi:hypothetical protein
VTLLAKPKVLALLFASTFALTAPSAHAIDLVVHASTVAKAEGAGLQGQWPLLPAEA